MIKSRESLEWICDCIINDRRIPSYYNQYEQLDMQLDDPNDLRIVRRPTNKKAVIDKRRTSTAGVGKTSMSPVRKSLGGGTPTKFGSPRRSSSPTRGNQSPYNNHGDKKKYLSTDFKEDGYVSAA